METILNILGSAEVTAALAKLLALLLIGLAAEIWLRLKRRFSDDDLTRARAFLDATLPRALALAEAIGGGKNDVLDYLQATMPDTLARLGSGTGPMLARIEAEAAARGVQLAKPAPRPD